MSLSFGMQQLNGGVIITGDRVRYSESTLGALTSALFPVLPLAHSLNSLMHLAQVAPTRFPKVAGLIEV